MPEPELLVGNNAVAGPPPSMPTPMPPAMPMTAVYNYVNPITHDVVTSLLPPDHPQMVCLQQGHIPHTRYGLLGTPVCPHAILPLLTPLSAGVLAAVFWFPLGIGLCLLDRRVKCDRCGLVIDDGMCSL